VSSCSVQGKLQREQGKARLPCFLHNGTGTTKLEDWIASEMLGTAWAGLVERRPVNKHAASMLPQRLKAPCTHPMAAAEHVVLCHLEPECTRKAFRCCLSANGIA